MNKTNIAEVSFLSLELLFPSDKDVRCDDDDAICPMQCFMSSLLYFLCIVGNFLLTSLINFFPYHVPGLAVLNANYDHRSYHYKLEYSKFQRMISRLL